MTFLSTVKAYVRKLFARKGSKKGVSGDSSELIFSVLPHEDPAYIPKPMGLFMKRSRVPILLSLLDEEEDFFPDGEENGGGIFDPFEWDPKLGV